MAESHRSRLDDLLSIWLKASEKPAPEALCGDDPSLLAELKREIAERRAQPTRDVMVSGPAPDAKDQSFALESRPHVDGYGVLTPLGAGGMGTVWTARQESTQRLVALKLLHPSFVGSASARARFGREVELSARLEHPNIARIYDSGLERGIDFLAMELIDGVAITRHVAEQRLSLHEIIGLMILVCRAVQHAHQNGVIHRDLKPSNILVTAAGQPKVLDFGLAKAMVEDGPEITVTGEIAGTPAYMSPEQARGAQRLVDTRSDVYSLGLIFHEMLTGRLPHETTGSYLQIMQRIAQNEPATPQRLRADLDADLCAIVLKSLAMERDDRYSAAGDLADDLERYRDGDPVLAQPQTTIYLIRKGLRRHSRVAMLGSLLVIGLIAGVGAYIRQIDQERHRTATALLRAQEQRQLAQENLQALQEETAGVMRLVNDLVFRVNRQLSAGGADPASRASLLELARRALSQMSDHAFLQQDRARAGSAAQLQLADLLSSAGKTDDAETMYRSIIADLEKRLAPATADPQPRRDLAVAQTRLARLYLAKAEYDPARRALDSAQSMLDAVPQSAAAADRWNLWITRGDLEVHSGKPSSAIQPYQNALELVPGDIRDAELLHMRVLGLTRLADAHIAATPDAADALAAAIDNLKSAIDAERAVTSAGGAVPLLEQGVRRLKLAQILLRAGQSDDASSVARQAQEIFQNALKQSPTPPDVRQNLALSLLAEADAMARAHPVESAQRRAAANVIVRALLEEQDPSRQADLERLLSRATTQP
jgi:tetratricopeptide (TPR) repeat protein